MDNVIKVLLEEKRIVEDRYEYLENERYRLLQELKEFEQKMEAERENALQINNAISILEGK